MMTRVYSRESNPYCKCTHAYLSHGNSISFILGMIIIIGGAFILPVVFANTMYGYTGLLSLSGFILFIKSPFKKHCLICDCKNYDLDFDNKKNALRSRKVWKTLVGDKEYIDV